MCHDGLRGSKPRIAAMNVHRQGAVLIIVTGLSMILLGIAVGFMQRMRSDSQDTRAIVAEAQSRLMFHAALMYLQEGSRLGWGEESFGWTDVRDGSLGPRPPRDCSATSPGTGIPAPSWWTYGPYIPSPDDSQLPPANRRRWPCPGSVVRCPMAVPVQPPYATQLRCSYNSVGVPAGKPAYGQPGWETPWITAPTGVDPIQRTGPNGAALPTASYWPIAWADDIFAPARGATAALDPQPLAELWHDPAYVGAPGQIPDFISGAIQPGVVDGDWSHTVNDGVSSRKVQLAVRGGSENTSWFRAYREVQSDHDGDGDPAYDRVVMYDKRNPALKNWNVFVIACGAGATRGYRFWDQADLSTWESQNGYPAGSVTLGQEFAAASGLFASQADFSAVRAAAHVMWFRVEWSALQGGGFIPEKYSWSGMRIYERYDPWANPPAPEPKPYPMMLPGPFPGWQARKNEIHDEYNSDLMLGVSEGGYADGLRYSAPKTYGGNFRWVQRLDHEPVNW